MKIKKNIFTFLGILIFLFLVYMISLLVFSTENKNIVLMMNRIYPLQTSKDIVLIEINDQTLAQLGYPLERKYLVDALEKISHYKPGVIGIDILFGEKSQDEEVDQKLQETFKKLGNVVLGYEIEGQNIKYPYFKGENIGFGYFNPEIERNNVVYSFRPFIEFSGSVYESFSFQILRKYFNYIYGKNEFLLGNESIKKGIYHFFEKKIPMDSRYIFDFKNKNLFHISPFSPQDMRKIQHYSFNDVLGGKELDIQDKIVLIGYTSKGLDKFVLPNTGEQSGVYIHLNILNNILMDNYIIHFHIFIELGIVFLFISLIIILNLSYKDNKLSWLFYGFVIAFIIILVVYFFLIKITNIPIFPHNPVGFILILFLSFFGTAILKYQLSDKNKKALASALSEYVSGDIVNEILYSTGEVSLSGEKKKISIFFSDIAGFTTISEKLSPEDLVAFLRVYLGKMSNIIMDHKGFINKYEGDAIMALWGVFSKSENFGVIDACNACVEQEKKLGELNAQWEKEGKDILSVRMGLHMGEAIIGNIGAEGRKMEFTALGDSVNLASRLEGVNKFYGTNICVSVDVYQEAKDFFEFRYLDKIRVKGKNIGVDIYELVGKKGEIGVFRENIITDFEEGYQLYLQRDFESAKEIFIKLSKLGDNPSKIYLQRCEIFIKNPPAQDWDGIWTLDEK